MPTYVYVCKTCKHSEDRFERITAPLDTTHDCTKCVGGKLQRKIVGGVIADAKLRFSNKYPYTSRSLPLRMPGCKTDGYGHTVVESAQHEREIMAGKFNGERYERT